MPSPAKKIGGQARKLHKPIPTLALNFPADKPINRKTATVIKTRPNPELVDPTALRVKPRHKKSDRVDIFRLKTKIKRYLRRRNPERAVKKALGLRTPQPPIPRGI